ENGKKRREEQFQTAAFMTFPGRCPQVKEFDASHHATAAQILGSLDNVLAEVVAGGKTFHGKSPDAVSGCEQCHGSEVKVNSDGTLDAATWPNSGIGRLNPDGSKGTCAACHSRHTFSAAQARHPDTCGKCHLGPDHPQKEIYAESKHGISFFANTDKMNLNSSKWIVGEDYSAAPTCATCHMSATRDLPVTHDIGSRISWEMRAPVSQKIDAKAISQGKTVKPWLERRKEMQNVCGSCHGRNFSDNFYAQLDAFIGLYNDKFAIPGAKLIKALKEEKLLTKTEFDEKLEWTWYLLWHHEGRRARHGAAMMGPDYAHWHGLFEVAQRFYNEMIPEIREIIEKARHSGNEAAANKVQTLLDEVLNSEHHRWFVGQQNKK
ncbi:MAG: hydroxylamine oxidoreductase, partial [Magnetococcales bacterium]|nr:hydroxylamine oxidoreductase [Magnetococcales bacterium]